MLQMGKKESWLKICAFWYFLFRCERVSAAALPKWCYLSEHKGLLVCQCARGWTGLTCAMDINECMGVRCENGSTCFNTPGSYKCICTPEWTEKLCNIGNLCTVDFILQYKKLALCITCPSSTGRSQVWFPRWECSLNLLKETKYLFYPET